MRKTSTIIISLLFVLCLFASSMLMASDQEAFTVYPSTQIASATTTYSNWIHVGDYSELTIFLDLTAQGAYTNETMNVSVQTRSPSEDAIDLTNVSFTEIGNKTGSVPFNDYMTLIGFGAQVRLKIVTAGDSVAYTVEFTAHAKK